MQQETFLDTRAAANYLNLKPATLEAWRTRGGGPRYVRLGTAIRYRLSDIEAYVEARTEASTSQRGAA